MARCIHHVTKEMSALVDTSRSEMVSGTWLISKSVGEMQRFESVPISETIHHGTRLNSGPEPEPELITDPANLRTSSDDLV